MKTVCKPDMCTGCKACIDRCPQSAVTIADSMKSLNAVIDEKKCVGCGACEKVCQQVSPAPLTKPLSWYQGWTEDAESRRKSTSGGFAYGLMKRFIEEGGHVCSCLFAEGKVGYEIVSSVAGLDGFRGSKYVKSDPEGIYKKVLDLLKSGEKVMFLGLPCHVGALKKFAGGKCADGLTTVDILCHGSPSFSLLERFLKENKADIGSLEKLTFRDNDSYRISGIMRAAGGERKDISFTPEGIRDRYSIAFLNALFLTENCYSCHYARSERVSDITLGDSLGSGLKGTPGASDGISLALCQTAKGEQLFLSCGFKTFPVDVKKAVGANQPLRQKVSRPAERMRFFSLLESGRTVKSSVTKCYPRYCLRQDIKAILKKLHIM